MTNANNSNFNNERETICQNIAKSILNHNNDSDRLTIAQINKLIKIKSAEFKLDGTPKFTEIIKFMPQDNYYKKLLRVKPVKTQSGVAVITVMPMPYDCPHGKCIYCPGGKEYNTPLSYIGTEPATIIAQSLNFDPYQQVRTKVEQLVERGHEVSKAELVIVGGTFPFYPLDYQIDFVDKLYRALNSFDVHKKSTEIYCQDIAKEKFQPDYREPVSVSKSEDSSFISKSSNLKSLRIAQLQNQNASIRCVGLTVETKPDYCKLSHVNMMLDLGTTRIELGVQSLSDTVFKLVNRGHSLQDVYEAFEVSRNCGFKIGAHMMPGLPGSDFSKDIEDAVTLFSDNRLKPDMLKIYPTLVVPNTGLHELYQRKKYFSYSTEDLVNLLVEVKKIIPPWVRIMRIQREIEPDDIISGPKMGNIRQLVLNELKRRGIKCKCIRCREIGLLNQTMDISDYEPRLSRLEYTASNGREVFLSYEIDKQDMLLGFLRLRIMSNPLRQELRVKGLAEKDGNKEEFGKHANTTLSAIVRELHIYGQVEGISNQNNNLVEAIFNKQGERLKYNKTQDLSSSLSIKSVQNPSLLKFQHKGLGRALLAEAEKICKEEFNIHALSVISAIGTRDYYRKFGYTNNGPYVTKLL